jgi:hypothetical protein
MCFEVHESGLLGGKENIKVKKCNLIRRSSVGSQVKERGDLFEEIAFL